MPRLPCFWKKNVTPSIEERVIHEPSTYTMMLFYYKLKLYSDISLQQRFKVCNSRGIWEIVNISIETNGSIEMSFYLVISSQQYFPILTHPKS